MESPVVANNPLRLTANNKRVDADLSLSIYFSLKKYQSPQSLRDD
jgi:hypothetical protein